MLGFNGYGSIYQIGSTKAYVSPNALYLADVVQDGDTIQIDAETFMGQASLAVWRKNDLLIKGVGGRPSLIVNGENIMGKGIWVLGGNNIIVENIEFSGATVPDNNGAGIRLDGIGMTVRHCYFHDNENGILTSNLNNGDLLIEFSEFENNGYGDGFTHNLYIGRVNSLTFRFNYSHHADIGHNLKSRAKENYIMYNRIMDEQIGNSSRLIDLPNGGIAIIMGNLLMQGENAVNNNLLGYGLEGLTNGLPHQIHVINNTFVNKRAASCIFISITNGTSVANISNNIFAGKGQVVNGSTTTKNTNYVDATISNLAFADEINYNYQLTSLSPAIDYGTIQNPVNGHSLTPDSTYKHPTNYETRNLSNNMIDAGAYEFDQMISVTDLELKPLSVYPNPTNGVLTVETRANHIRELAIQDFLGCTVLSKSNSNKIDLSSVNPGIYYIQIITTDGKEIIKLVIKQ